MALSRREAAVRVAWGRAVGDTEAPPQPRTSRRGPAAGSLTRSPFCFCATENGRDLEGALSELTSETDVPVVFVKRRKIGGYGPTLKVGMFLSLS